jgi:hypothetical protein
MRRRCGAVELDPPAVGPEQSRDHVDQRRLAGAGAAEQRSDAAFAFEGRLHGRGAKRFRHVDAQHA